MYMYSGSVVGREALQLTLQAGVLAAGNEPRRHR